MDSELYIVQLNINITINKEVVITNDNIMDEKFINSESERLKLEKEKENEISTIPNDRQNQLKQEI